jgi:hypothetical protein
MENGSIGVVAWDDNYATSLYNELVSALDNELNDPNEKLEYEGIAFISNDLMKLFNLYFGSVMNKKVIGKEIICKSLIGAHDSNNPLLWSKVLLFHSDYYNQFFNKNKNVDMIIPYSAITVSNLEESMLIKLPETKFNSFKIFDNKIKKRITIDTIGIKKIILKEETEVSTLTNNILAD